MINFIIISNTRADKYYELTTNLLNSIHNAKYPLENKFDKYRITIIETGNFDNKYQYDNCDTVKFDYENFKEFNYNHALNLGIKSCLSKYKDNDWFCYMSNDIICDKNWIVEINNNLLLHPEVQSVSSRCDRTIDDVSFGYTLGKHLQGYCFMNTYEALTKLGLFDEDFDLYFQDDDYLEQLRLHNIIHMCVKSSIVKHIGQLTTGKENMNKLCEGRDKFVRKYSALTYLQREYEKYH